MQGRLDLRGCWSCYPIKRMLKGDAREQPAHALDLLPEAGPNPHVGGSSRLRRPQPLCVAPSRTAFFVTRAKSNMGRYSSPSIRNADVRRSTVHAFARQTASPPWSRLPWGLRGLCLDLRRCGASAGPCDGSRLPVRSDHFTNQINFWGFQPSYPSRTALQNGVAGRSIARSRKAASSMAAVLPQRRENAVKTHICDCVERYNASVAIVKKNGSTWSPAQALQALLHRCLSVPLIEKTCPSSSNLRETKTPRYVRETHFIKTNY